MYNKELKNNFKFSLALLICLCLFWNMRNGMSYKESDFGSKVAIIGNGIMVVCFMVFAIGSLCKYLIGLGWIG